MGALTIDGTREVLTKLAEEDFDIASLAAYLHLMPAQISKLADRGKIPARRVGGEWRFSRPEIHQWLEERIGLSDDAELAQMETNLERVDTLGETHLSIAALLPEEAIGIPLQARTRGSVIEEMCNLAVNTGMLWDAAKMAEAVHSREAMHSTALDIGVALLHPRRPMNSILGGPVLSLGITGQGIPFGNAGGGLTDVFFLICATADHEHLRLLARLSRMIGDADWLAALREAMDSHDAARLLADKDAQLN